EVRHHRWMFDAGAAWAVIETADELGRGVDVIEGTPVPHQAVRDGQTGELGRHGKIVIDAVQSRRARRTVFNHRADPKASFRIALAIVEADPRDGWNGRHQ